MTKVTGCSCWHKSFIPKGLSAPALGLNICIKSWKKNGIKSDFKDIFLKLATNEWSDKTFMLTSKLCPLGAVCPWPAPGLYTCIKSWKKLYKIRLQKRFFLNLQQMTKVTRCSCWHKNVVPKGLSAPALGLNTCIKSWKKLYKIRLQRDLFETCSKWPKWQDVPVDIKCFQGVVSPCLGAIYMYKIMKKIV